MQSTCILPIQHQRFQQKCFRPFFILKNHRPHCTLCPYKNIMSARSTAYKPQMKQGFYQRARCWRIWFAYGSPRRARSDDHYYNLRMHLTCWYYLPISELIEHSRQGERLSQATRDVFQTLLLALRCYSALVQAFCRLYWSITEEKAEECCVL